MRVALVHEFLTQLGGAERVLEALHDIFPEAPVYTLVYDEQKTEGRFRGYDLRTSFLQRLPKKHYKWGLPLMVRAIESFDFTGYDLVLSDSSAFAKGAITKKPTRHICYCHTPTRYLWENMDEYISSLPYNIVIRAAAKRYLKLFLKGWDFAAAQRPDFFIANSLTVQARIKKYYGRDSEVIYPPVDTEFFNGGNGKNGDKGNYYFTVSRLEHYKRIDLVIEAFKILGLPLKVAGEGTEFKKFTVHSSQPKNIEFLGRVDDYELRKLYRGAKALVFPALEDAGMVVIEALACGTPVIGLAAGGTAEFVQDGMNGVLFKEQNVQSIIDAVSKFQRLNFEPEMLRRSALPFSKESFEEKIRKLCA